MAEKHPTVESNICCYKNMYNTEVVLQSSKQLFFKLVLHKFSESTAKARTIIVHELQSTVAVFTLDTQKFEKVIICSLYLFLLA